MKYLNIQLWNRVTLSISKGVRIGSCPYIELWNRVTLSISKGFLYV